MNARQRRKLESIKRRPWPAMWRGKAWHDALEEWVTLWPDHPEIDELIREAKSRFLVGAALSQGRVHAKKQARPALRQRMARLQRQMQESMRQLYARLEKETP